MHKLKLMVAIAFFVVVGTALASTFVLTKTAETNNTISFSWAPQPGADGYRFYAPGTDAGTSCDGTRVSRTFDPSKTTTRFAKVADGTYCVEPVKITPIGSAVYGDTPPPPPVTATIKQTIAVGATLAGVVNWRAVYDANGDGVEDDPGSVRFFVDNVQVLEEINPPFGDTDGFWNSTTVSNGTHLFKANAVNDAGTVLATNSVSATVANNTPPPPPPPPPPAGGFPDSTNTGYDAAPDYPGSLSPAGSAGCELPIVSNKTYRFCAFGSLAIGSSGNPVSNVTFYGCRFKAVAVENALLIMFGKRDTTDNGITFDYSSLEPGVAAPPTPYNQSYQYGIEASGSYGSFVGKLTVSHSDIWGFGNAINVRGSNQANPQIYRDNYIHDAAQDGGSYHTDGIGNTTDSGNDSYVTIDHNTIVSAGNTNGIAFQRGTYHHFTVTNNLLGGFGFTTAIWATNSHDIVFTGNTYTTALKPHFGPLYPQSFWTTPGSVWRNNKWLVPSGAAWGNPLHNGWYWLPNTSTIDGQSNPSDSPFVSQTDYTG